MIKKEILDKEDKSLKRPIEYKFYYFRLGLFDYLSIPLLIVDIILMFLFFWLFISTMNYLYIIGFVAFAIALTFIYGLTYKFIHKFKSSDGDKAGFITNEYLKIEAYENIIEPIYTKLDDVENISLEKHHKNKYGIVNIKLKDQENSIKLINIYKPNTLIDVYNKIINNEFKEIE